MIISAVINIQALPIWEIVRQKYVRGVSGVERCW